MAEKSQKAVEKQEQERRRTALQQQQIQNIQGQSHGDRARLLDVAVESELDSPSDELANLKARDFPLSNYDENGADTFEVKGIQEILALLDEARYPHSESVLQGAVREYAFNDQNESLESRQMGEFIVNESYLLGTYSRFKRGEGGFERETNAKETHEAVTVDGTDGDSSSRLRSKIPGL